MVVKKTRLQVVTHVFCGIVIALSVGFLLIWILGGVSAQPIAAHRMKFNAGLGLLLAAVALWIETIKPSGRFQEISGRALAVIVFLLGSLTLLEYATGISVGIDELFVTDVRNTESTAFPGRMAPNAAVCFILLGTSLLLLDGKNWLNRFAQRLAIMAGIIGILALIGYIFEAQGLYQVSRFIRLSPYTAFGVCLLSAGILLARPQYGIVKILISKHPSGVFARRMIVAALLCPPLIGWLAVSIEKTGYISGATSSALVAILTILLFMSLVWHSADAMSSSEGALNESELQFRTMANSIPQLAWMADQRGRIFWYNQRWYDYTGTTLEEMNGSTWKNVYHPDHAKPVAESFATAVKAGSSWEHTFPLRSRDGDWRWFLSRARPVRDDDGKITFWFGTNTDVTENLRVERELTESKEIAERANQAKTQFLANMSHEIRTPIGAIMGFTDLLKNPSCSPSDRLAYTLILERNSQQLLRLIDDILDLSKVEAGKIALEKTNFSLTEFLGDFSSVMSLRAEEKGIKFLLKFEGEIPHQIYTDQLRLRQVLANVAGNAVKFTERGHVDLVVKYEAPALIFKVTDTGPGISIEQQGKLFQPFGQADPSMTRRYGGTGLGLILSKRLSYVLGGDLVLAQSDVGQGSVFLATIDPGPVNSLKTVQSTAPGPIEIVESKGRLAGFNILLVEDSPDNRTLISTYLKKSDAQVEIAEDGDEGVQRALKTMPDIVLMDIQMPKMDGHQATRKLRDSGFTKPIIALTAHAMREERDKCFEAGCTDYLTKPIQRDRLIEVILRNRSSIAPAVGLET